jgi:hypothetical protein
MASRSQLYPLARQLFATAQLNWPNAAIQCALLASAYVPDFTQQYLAGIPSSYILAQTGNIQGLSASGGYLNGYTTSFGVVDSEAEAGYLLFYEATSSPETSTLILFIDSPDIQGMPQILDGLQYFLYQNLTYGGWARL